MFYLELLGQARLGFGPDRHRLAIPRQSMALLAYLALERDAGHAREALIERFWPDREPELGKASLASALWRLRRSLPAGAPSLLATASPGEAGIAEAAPLWLDAACFAAAVRPHLATSAPLEAEAARSLVEAVSLYRGDLMTGWYDDWVLVERERLRGLYVAGLIRLMEHEARRGALATAIELAQRVLKVEPLRETVHRRLIELHAANGDPGGAVRQYERCLRLLLEELGVAPMPETRGALDAVRQARKGRPAASVAAVRQTGDPAVNPR
jgi:DNA-binding SARP family transcriptional activator